ncbi:MAG: class I SAM-dependent methyltransferase [Planctomycetota bacterium]
MIEGPEWWYDEMRQIGTDFEDAEQVAAYESKQGTSPERERALVDRLGIGLGDVVVEFGCGTGEFAVQAALAGARVRACDVSPAMLDSARAKARSAGVEITFHQAGFLSYEHAGDDADFVVTKAALHHLPDFWKQVALLRVRDMLRRDGTLYVWDVAFSFPAREYREGIETWIERLSGSAGETWAREDFERHVREEYSTYWWVMEGMLERASFCVETHCLTDAYAEFIARAS